MQIRAFLFPGDAQLAPVRSNIAATYKATPDCMGTGKALEGQLPNKGFLTCVVAHQSKVKAVRSDLIAWQVCRQTHYGAQLPPADAFDICDSPVRLSQGVLTMARHAWSFP